MKIKAVVYEAREVTLDTNFYRDGDGNLYRLFPDKYTGGVTANVISADFKTFKKGEMIGSRRLSELEPVEAFEYIHAAVLNAEYEIETELSAATGEEIAARIEFDAVSSMAKEADQDTNK